MKAAGSSAHRPNDQLRAGQEVGRVSAGLHDYSSSNDELAERRPTRQVRAEGSQVMTFSRSMHDRPTDRPSAWHFRMNESSARYPRRPDARKRTESIPSPVNCSGDDVVINLPLSPHTRNAVDSVRLLGSPHQGGGSHSCVLRRHRRLSRSAAVSGASRRHESR